MSLLLLLLLSLLMLLNMLCTVDVYVFPADLVNC